MGKKIRWQPIEIVPDRPQPVVFYSATRTWTDQNGTIYGEFGSPCCLKEPYRDERADIGYWDGKAWRWNGTGHKVWEFDYHTGDKDLPTHWMPLPEPPNFPQKQPDRA